MSVETKTITEETSVMLENSTCPALESNPKKFDFQFRMSSCDDSLAGIHFDFGSDRESARDISSKSLLQTLEEQLESLKKNISLNPNCVFSIIIHDKSKPLEPIITTISDIKALNEFINHFRKEHLELSPPVTSSGVSLKS